MKFVFRNGNIDITYKRGIIMSDKILMKTKEECSFSISDLDANENPLASHILQKFQDIAVHNANILNVGFDDLIQKDYIWVVTKIRYKVLKPIKKNQKLYITTWPLPKGVIDFCRDYLIEDENGVPYIKGTSRWCITNIKTRRLVRTKVVEYLNGNGEYFDKKCFDEPYFPLTPFSTEELEPVLEHKVVFTDLDHNKHMNNTKFADLSIDSIPEIEDCAIDEMQVNFLSECLYKDTIKTYVKANNDNEYEVIGIKTDGKLSFHTFIKLKHI